MKRVIAIQGRNYSLAAYTAAWRKVLALPTDVTLTAFNWFPESQAETLRHFRKGLHDRINRRVEGFGHTLRPKVSRGRKDCSDWFWLMKRTSRELNSNTAIHWLPLELRAQFANRLSN